MNSEGLKSRLEALQERRDRIDAEIEQLESQLDTQERAEQRGVEVLEVEPARGGGSYVLQRVLYGKPSCRCARATQACEWPGASSRQRCSSSRP
jgi:hypothetical protein